MKHFILSANLFVYLIGFVIEIFLRLTGQDSHVLLSALLVGYVTYYTYNEWNSDWGETS